MIRTADFIKALELRVLVPTTHEEMPIDSADINRPGLQLAGFYENFANKRPQVIGKAEMSYLDSLDNNLRLERLRTYFSYPIPCVIISRGMQPPEELLQLAREKDVPVLQSDLITTRVFINVITYLRQCLAPRTTMHGVLLDVFGIGVLITGRSGVGKSETALELVNRGHRLIADDAVEIRKVSNNTLVGSAPDNIRHFIELRGVGVLNVRRLFGVGAVKMTERIDMVIQLEIWDGEKVYDRLGLEDEFVNILDVDIPVNVVPVKPGRNLAIIIEAAAKNNREKKMGYNAARELLNKLGMNDDVTPSEKELAYWHDF